MIGPIQRPDYPALLAAIRTTRGKNKGQLRRSRGKLSGRAYYLWRWTRFHAGIDTTLPMVAEWELDPSDHYRDDLNAAAEYIATCASVIGMQGNWLRFLDRVPAGTSVGRHVWRRAFYGEGGAS